MTKKNSINCLFYVFYFDFAHLLMSTYNNNISYSCVEIESTNIIQTHKPRRGSALAYQSLTERPTYFMSWLFWLNFRIPVHFLCKHCQFTLDWSYKIASFSKILFEFELNDFIFKHEIKTFFKESVFIFGGKWTLKSGRLFSNCSDCLLQETGECSVNLSNNESPKTSSKN